jgi:hypothetical protein
MRMKKIKRTLYLINLKMLTMSLRKMTTGKMKVGKTRTVKKKRTMILIKRIYYGSK